MGKLKNRRAGGLLLLVLFGVVLALLALPAAAESAVKTDWIMRHSNGEPTAMAVDSQGNVYVTGTAGGYSNPCYATIKYSSRGRPLWISRYQGPGIAALNNIDIAKAIAVDVQGNIFVTGYSQDWSGSDFATIKYSSRGKELWVRRCSGLSASDDLASAMAVDGQGNVYVTGYSQSPKPGWVKFNNLTVKYDTNGQELWNMRANGSVGIGGFINWGFEAYTTVDTQGNIYVADTVSSNKVAGNYHIRTLKYSNAGQLLWSHSYPAETNSYTHDSARAISVDRNGNVYVTRFSYGEGWVTIKYSQTP